MVLQALVAPVPSFLITFANGLAFGVFGGWMLSLFGHALAAAVCFGISRSLGRVPVEVLVGKTGLESADRWFARWGLYAVFVGRLIPGVAFDVVSYAAGLTRMRLGSFMAASALGILPQTFLYSYLGRQAPQYVGLFLVTSGLVVVAVVVATVMRRKRRRLWRKPTGRVR
ncbi:MAG TPA: VTT domain-containing protein, partial [Rubrobacteraceae bacterium]|nr:VTT domain-containing protein [Rubrobacteraceae bacterium]